MKNPTKKVASIALMGSLAAGTLLTTTPAAQARSTAYLYALGDSYPAGDPGNQHRAYPEWTARKMTTTSTTFVTRNLAHGGWTTTDVLNQLKDGATLRRVASANTVVITVGANDVSLARPNPRAAATSMSSYQPTINQMQGRLDAILKKVSTARKGNVRRVVVSTYNNLYADGSPGATAGSAFVKGADNITRATNKAIMATCAKYRMACVDIYPAFNTRTVNSYITSDGTHPNLAGHKLIAGRIHAVLVRR